MFTDVVSELGLVVKESRACAAFKRVEIDTEVALVA
jgi:hypothetical protein